MTLIDAQPVSTLDPLLGLPKLIAKDDIYLLFIIYYIYIIIINFFFNG